LSDCQCMDSLKSTKLKDSSKENGPLPEAMVSPVRKEILEHNLLKLASGLLGDLGQAIAGQFVEDSTVREAIVEGVGEGLDDSTPGGTNIQASSLRLDAFGSWNKNIEIGRGFILEDQISKWMTIFSLENIFKGRSSNIEVDHGLQTFHIIRSLVEMQYMYGIDAYNNVGLAVDPTFQTSLSTYDPRLNGTPKTVFGSYKVEFDTSNSVFELAVDTKEVWQRSDGTLNLSEQAKLWSVMAKVFGNLRPDNREHIAKMFEARGGLLPDDGHLLALTVLPSLSDILADKLIDRDSRKVMSKIDQWGNPYEEAGPLAIARMINAVQVWSKELDKIEDIDVDQSLRTQLEEAGPSFKDAARLAIQHMIGSHFTKDSIGELTVLPAVNYDLSAAGEIVEALIRVNRNLISSDLLSDITHEVLRSYYSYATYAISNTSIKVKFSDLVWLKRVSNELNGYDLRRLGMPWVGEVSAVLNSYLIK
jgi:hypothetical protein